MFKYSYNHEYLFIVDRVVYLRRSYRLWKVCNRAQFAIKTKLGENRSNNSIRSISL
jgi:hypothetical protein